MLRRTCLVILLAVLPCLVQAAPKPNIVLITLDSTRADRMDFLGSKHKLTKNLDVVAHDGIVYERAYAQAPGTVVSQATLLTGTYPQTNGASELGSALPRTVPFLPDLLHANGYRTGAFVGSILLDPKSGMAPGFDRGFDTYDAGFHPPVAGETRYQSVEHRGSQVVERAIAWLAQSKKQPFFLWVHIFDPHAPYGSSYDAAVSAADAAAGKLLIALRTQKLYDDTLIVIAADHGESLGAHGEDTHGVFLYDDTIQVPLVMKLPRNELAGKRVSGRVRLLDVAPSVLEAAGVPVPSQMQGQSLIRIAKTRPTADQAVYSRSEYSQRAFGWSALESWRAGKYLYIRAPQPELYDLNGDPGATHNLAQSSKATLDTMASQLESFDSHFGAGNKPGQTSLSSTEMQKLASLGYVGLQKSASGVSTASSGTDPKDAIATANKIDTAMLALDNGEAKKALASLQSIAGSQPNAYLAQYGLGVAQTELRQYAPAIKALHQAIQLQPDSPWAHYEMGKSLLKTGDFKTAAVHLEIATTRLPEFGEAHALLAEAYDHLGRKADAQRERSKAPHAPHAKR
jgi:arylsulfatase A-like enzyme/Flp pilus assembly protein TadD